MIGRNYILSTLAICALAVIGSAPAHAQRIGEAAVVKNEVIRVTGSGGTQINVGDALLRDETVRTGADSAARLVMSDSTNLSLGPRATLKLDRTVFDNEHSYREVTIRMTTGHSASSPGIPTRTPTRSPRALRRSASAAPRSIFCRNRARPRWCCRKAPAGPAH